MAGILGKRLCYCLISKTPRRMMPNLSRSLSFSVQSKTLGTTQLLTKTSNPSLLTACPQRFISSEVDRELDEFLNKEIQLEKKETKRRTLPQVLDFDVKTDGPRVTMTKKAKGETIAVKFDINESDPNYVLDAEEGDGAEQLPDPMTRPPFVVEITKSDGSVLLMNCAFPQTDEYEDEMDEGDDQAEKTPQRAEAGVQDIMEDMFEIVDVSIVQGTERDEAYTHHASVMDRTLYELFMDMLDERGVNSEFVRAMSEFSTVYEKNKYVDFLQQLKSFVRQ